MSDSYLILLEPSPKQILNLPTKNFPKQPMGKSSFGRDVVGMFNFKQGGKDTRHQIHRKRASNCAVKLLQIHLGTSHQSTDEERQKYPVKPLQIHLGTRHHIHRRRASKISSQTATDSLRYTASYTQTKSVKNIQSNCYRFT